MMAAAADARAALSSSRSRSRAGVVARALVHAAQAVGLALLLRVVAELPWAAAAAPPVLRFAASFLAPPRVFFLAANVIVVALATLFPRDAADSSSPPSASADPSGSSSPSSDGDARHPFLAFLDPRQERVAGAEAPPEVVFEDKEAVHVTTVRAQPPRRTMSDKTRSGGAAAAAAAGRTSTTRAASPPELRRAKSENGRRRQRRSAAAAAAVAAPVELGADDAEAFRQAVEAFIAKQQTWFHREESLIIARATAGAGAGEDVPAAIAGAAVAVK